MVAMSTTPTTFLTPPRCSLHYPPSRSTFSLLPSASAATSRIRAKMSSPSTQAPTVLPSDPEKPIVLGLGGIAVDFLAMVDAFPNPDDKIRSTSLKRVHDAGPSVQPMLEKAEQDFKVSEMTKVGSQEQGNSEIKIPRLVQVSQPTTQVVTASKEDTSTLTLDSNKHSKVQGGGNAGNALTCAAHLGLNARLISKVASDIQGRGILKELEADGVDTSFLVVSEEGNSPFTYVIVDKQTKTRTCIHTPGSPPMVPDDLSESSLLSALDGARLVYFDVRLHETALVVANEASRKGIPILIDAEKKREGLDDLLNMADYVVCSAKFPQVWTEAPTVPSALVSMLLKLQNVKFVIVTLGEDGCIMLERSVAGASVGVQSEEMDVDSLVEELRQKVDNGTSTPKCISSKVMRLRAKGVGTMSGRLFLGTAEKIPPAELVDTTGAGDAFIGAVLYALCTNKAPDKMLPFAAQVAATCCRSLGARSGLPNLSDPLLAPFLG